jgi:hypothetical protein
MLIMLEILKKEVGPINIEKMTIQKFNKTEMILAHIDTQITKWISEGKNTDVIIEELRAKIDRLSITIANCSKTESRYKYIYTHNKVCEKRIEDMLYIQTLMIKYYEYAVYPNNKLFNLIKFRDKIAPEKFIVEFSE